MIFPADLELVPKDDPELLANLQWYYENLKVRTDRGLVVPFELLPAQVRLERIKVTLRRENLPVYILNLKSRRVGASTWSAGAFYKDAHDFPGRDTIMIAHDDKSTKKMLAMVKFFFRSHYGKEAKAPRDSDVGLVLPDLESTFMIYTAGSRERTARSFAAQSLLLSEIDYYEVPDVYTAAMQVLPDAYPAFVVVESTSRGPGGQMEKFWRRVENEQTDFVGNFTGWFDRPENVRKPTWVDLYKYAPAEWRETNRERVKTIMEVIRDALGTRKPGKKNESDGRGETGRGEQGGDGAGGRGENRPPAGTSTKEAERGSGALGDKRTPPGRLVSRGVPGRRGNGPDDDGDRSDGLTTGRLRSLREARAKRRKRKAKTVRRRAKAGLQWRGGDFERLISNPEKFLVEEYESSLSPYELDLMIDYELRLEQINWMRWAQFDKCNDSEIQRKREHPSRPEEAFEFSDEAILNPHTIARWRREAEKAKRRTIRFKVKESKERIDQIKVTPVRDALGKVTEWEKPLEGLSYVMGVDPSLGTERGDDTVAVVLREDTGDQVAELRCRIEPDLAINEVEALGVYYNCAFTAIEANSFGVEWAKRIAGRGTLPTYQREDPSRIEPDKKLPRIGWLTNATTRNQIFTTMRQVVRDGHCQIRSLDTLKECTTLWEGKEGDTRGRIEARPGTHDDGVMAYGIALRMLPKVKEQTEDVVVEEEGGPSELAVEMLAKFASKGRAGALGPIRMRRRDVVAQSPSREVPW